MGTLCSCASGSPVAGRGRGKRVRKQLGPGTQVKTQLQEGRTGREQPVRAKGAMLVLQGHWRVTVVSRGRQKQEVRPSTNTKQGEITWGRVAGRSRLSWSWGGAHTGASRGEERHT